jgi:hypothetical protein
MGIREEWARRGGYEPAEMAPENAAREGRLPGQEVLGSLLFADSSKAEFPRYIHTFNPMEERSNLMEPVREQVGIRTITARETTRWDPKRERLHEDSENTEIKQPFQYKGRLGRGGGY